MPWKNERLECYGVLRTVTGSLELHSYLRLTIANANDSNDYRDSLIYLSCHRFLTFRVL